MPKATGLCRTLLAPMHVAGELEDSISRLANRFRDLLGRCQLRSSQPVVADHPAFVGVGDRSALQRIQGSITGLPQNDLRRAESMNAFFIMPAVGDGFAKLFSTHPPMNRRVELLREMERGIMMLA